MLDRGRCQMVAGKKLLLASEDRVFLLFSELWTLFDHLSNMVNFNRRRQLSLLGVCTAASRSSAASVIVVIISALSSSELLVIGPGVWRDPLARLFPSVA